MNRVRQGLAALAIALTTGCSLMTPAKETHSYGPTAETADSIEAVLKDSPYVDRITRCDTPGAHRLLVIVQQAHYRDPDPNAQGTVALSTERALYAHINTVQCNIYQILLQLRPITGKVVLLEGVSREPKADEVAREYYRILDTLERENIIAPSRSLQKNMTFMDLRQELLTKYPPSSPDWGSYACIPGAAYLLALQDTAALDMPGNLLIAPAETAQSKRNAYLGVAAALERGVDEPWDIPEILDDREDVVLQRAAEMRSPTVVVVFGAGHRFGGTLSCGDGYPLDGKSYRDDAAVWNAEHPVEMFSLLEITPKGF